MVPMADPPRACKIAHLYTPSHHGRLVQPRSLWACDGEFPVPGVLAAVWASARWKRLAMLAGAEFVMLQGD